MTIEKFESLKELRKKLEALPEEKRKTVVLVNRHPNEGTMAISLAHHKDWEKHGAVVVPVPMMWTPHGIADAIRKGKLDEAGLKRLLDREVKTDFEIARFIYDTFDVPVVSLHASSYASNQPLSRPHLSFEGGGRRIANHYLIGRRVSGDWMLIGISPNEVTAEYRFKGSDSKSQPSSLPSWARHEMYSRERPVSRQYQLNFDYLNHPTINSRAIRSFSENCETDFEEILAHLAATWKKRSGVRRRLRV